MHLTVRLLSTSPLDFSAVPNAHGPCFIEGHISCCVDRRHYFMVFMPECHY